MEPDENGRGRGLEEVQQEHGGGRW
jgi:hypothetical protein